MTMQQMKNELAAVQAVIVSQKAERERKFLQSLPAELRQVMQYEHDRMIIQLNEEIY